MKISLYFALATKNRLTASAEIATCSCADRTGVMPNKRARDNANERILFFICLTFQNNFEIFDNFSMASGLKIDQDIFGSRANYIIDLSRMGCYNIIQRRKRVSNCFDTPKSCNVKAV